MGFIRHDSTVFSCDAKGCDEFKMVVKEVGRLPLTKVVDAPDGWMCVHRGVATLSGLWLCPGHALDVGDVLHRMPLK